MVKRSMRICEKQVFLESKEIMEKLAQMEEHESLIGMSSRGMIEIVPLGNSTYSVEFYDFSSHISYGFRRLLRLAGVSLAVEVLLNEAKGGEVQEYEFTMVEDY